MLQRESVGLGQALMMKQTTFENALNEAVHNDGRTLTIKIAGLC